MPMYNHECSECGAILSLIKKIAERDDSSTDTCPECGSVGTLNRMVAAPLISYSTTSAGGYGSRVPDGFKEVLKKIHNIPGARQTSSFL